MTRRINHQFATFWFVLNKQTFDSSLSESARDSACAEIYDFWKKACALIDSVQAAHPLRVFQEQHGEDTLDFERWEFCDQDPMPLTSPIDGKVAWSVSFYHAMAFEPGVLTALRDICIEQFKTAGADSGDTARLLTVETTTEYVESVTEAVQVL